MFFSRTWGEPFSYPENEEDVENKEEENVEKVENKEEEENVENEEKRVENEEENVENEKYPNNNWMLCIDFVFQIV